MAAHSARPRRGSFSRLDSRAPISGSAARDFPRPSPLPRPAAFDLQPERQRQAGEHTELIKEFDTLGRDIRCDMALMRVMASAIGTALLTRTMPSSLSARAAEQATATRMKK